MRAKKSDTFLPLKYGSLNTTVFSHSYRRITTIGINAFMQYSVLTSEVEEDKNRTLKIQVMRLNITTMYEAFPCVLSRGKREHVYSVYIEENLSCFLYSSF